MFQTEIIIFLQSYSNNHLNTFFQLITSLGYSSFIYPFFIVIIFGINYRIGFILLYLAIWNGISTDLLKNLFELPRPSNVDSAVQLLGKDYLNPTFLTGMGAESFFGLLPKESIEYLRTKRFDSYGFPSGHTSNSVVLWGGILLLFKTLWSTIFCALLILLIPLSRMYLGRHFLADVLGGYLVGSLSLYVFWRYVFHNEALNNFVFKSNDKIEFNLKTKTFILYSFILPLLLILTFRINHQYTANLLGLNLGFFLIWLKSIPNDSGGIFKRIFRVIIILCLFYTTNSIWEQVIEILIYNEPSITKYTLRALLNASLILISTEINIKMGLMNRENVAV